jgi:hypothetical protein
MIPEKYQNVQDLGNIANVVLSGTNPTENKEIYDIGIKITKEISGNYKSQKDVEIISLDVPKGADATAVRKTLLVPKRK